MCPSYHIIYNVFFYNFANRRRSNKGLLGHSVTVRILNFYLTFIKESGAKNRFPVPFYVLKTYCGKKIRRRTSELSNYGAFGPLEMSKSCFFINMLCPSYL